MKPRKKKGDLDDVAMGPDAQRYYDEEFLPRLSKIQKEVKRTTLGILVWGPGPTAGGLFDKRRQIRNKLREDGHAALFSEDIAPDNFSPAWSLMDQELAQALVIDCIILLYSSAGSIGEAHDFAQYSQVAEKMLVFVDQRDRHGYGAQGALKDLHDRHKNVEFFVYPKDVIECNLLEKVLLRVATLQIAKWRKSFR
jgi:hypothetical protein